MTISQVIETLIHDHQNEADFLINSFFDGLLIVMYFMRFLSFISFYRIIEYGNSLCKNHYTEILANQYNCY